jgi:hypothetical protein
MLDDVRRASVLNCCLSKENPCTYRARSMSKCNMTSITSSTVSRITESIVDELNPEEIILFGSYAQGNPNKCTSLGC